jgi:hypothetical protein
MALKLDIEKAYDRMEWILIIKILDRLGLYEKWVSLVRECISSPSFSMLINGSPKGHFSASRGFRQGDPLSPFLFIIGIEVLSRLLTSAENSGFFKGFPLAPTCPRVSHMLFVDDLIIFARASVEDAKAIQVCLNSYQLCSGQLVNVKKSVIMFSKKVPRGMQRAIGQVSSLKSSPFHAKYLSLPLCNEKSRSSTLEQVVESLKRSKGGKRIFGHKLPGFVLLKQWGLPTPSIPYPCRFFLKTSAQRLMQN